MSNEFVNPFDNEAHQFLVLTNTQGHHSLWPEYKAIPAGWGKVFGPDERASCINYVEQHWTVEV